MSFAADEITRLRAELAREREMSFAYKRHLLAEEKTSASRGAFLLAERERAKSAEAERDALRELLREARKTFAIVAYDADGKKLLACSDATLQQKDHK